MINVTYPAKFAPIVQRSARYKVARGGRGSAKSHSFSKLSVVRAFREKIKIGCFRETQNSIKDSVHALIVNKISELKLNRFFRITENYIRSWTGSEYIFKGLRTDPEAIKSIEDIDIAYIEEAESISRHSIEILKPTIRKPGSEIWINFNPESADSPVYHDFIVHPPIPEDIVSVEMNWRDNPWFPDVLLKEMEWCRDTDYEKYLWIWEGQLKAYAEDVIFKNKCEFDADFPEPPPGTRFYIGLDFGFSNDPLSCHRYFIKDNRLYIDYEVYGRGIELDEIPNVLLRIPEIKRWEIGADAARPDTISYLHNKGFRIIGAEKGAGSVEDGITFLRGFEKIVIHKRCPGAKDDYQNYRWKRDRITQEILPIPLDKNNHTQDDGRYALGKYIKRKISSFEVLKNL